MSPELIGLLTKAPDAINTALVLYFLYATIRDFRPELLLVFMVTVGTQKRREAALDALKVLQGQAGDPPTDPPEGLGQGP
jgi:hypothetical protein